MIIECWWDWTMLQLTINHTSYIFLTISTYHLVLHLLIWFLIFQPDFKLLQTGIDTCLGAQLDTANNLYPRLQIVYK